MFLNEEKFTRRMQLLLVALTAAACTVILHSVGVGNGFYHVYWWYDVVTHILGGIAVGALIISLSAEKKQTTAHILLIALLPIIGWEIFEIFFVSFATKSVGYATETAIDAVVGLLGVYGTTRVYKKSLKTTEPL